MICPEYGSTAITTGKRGFSIVAGLVGSKNYEQLCKSWLQMEAWKIVVSEKQLIHLYIENRAAIKI